MLIRLLGRPASLCKWPAGWLRQYLVVRGSGWGAAGRGVRSLGNSAVEGLSPRQRKIIGGWLLGCCGMVAGAVILGGVTRLTESGLSMVEWHLIKGMKPPRSQSEWEEAFEKYKQFPEYKYVHRDLTLEEFKRIFHMEYTHRMWGRLTGVAFLVPAAIFYARGWVTPYLRPRLLVQGGLLVFQGLLGWYMVRSGLEDKPEVSAVPRVSQYRLAAHLGTALTLYSSLLFTSLGLLLPPQEGSVRAVHKLKSLRGLAHGTASLVFFTALSGAFVAGLDAGLVYNSFPKFADRWIPDDLMALTPKWKNWFENATTTQFTHRVLGVLTASSIVGTCGLAWSVGLPGRARMAVNAFAAMSLVQVGLGIATLVYFVPTSLAAGHQSGSVALLSLALWLMHELRHLR